MLTPTQKKNKNYYLRLESIDACSVYSYMVKYVERQELTCTFLASFSLEDNYSQAVRRSSRHRGEVWWRLGNVR